MTAPTAHAPQPPSYADLVPAARELLPEMVEIRRRLHRRPELGLALPETQALVAADLRSLGLEPRLGTAVSSVSAVIEGRLPGPTILLRADMDALPVPEDTGLPFASEIAGRMHACGHDTHVTMLLGAARLLLARCDVFAGRVVLMFQPGEEGFHGARFMLDEGLLDQPAGQDVRGAFALHITTDDPTGVVTTRPGPMMASADTIRITVTGRGGHASAPHLALDPVPVAAEIILALQAMVTRRVDVFDPAVLTIAHLEGGFRDNIIPESVLLEGTLRTVSEKTRIAVRERIRQVADGICAAHGAGATVEIIEGYPVTVNDGPFAEWALDVARGVLGGDAVVVPPAPIMGAEDFSYVLQRVPGAMAFIGARPADQDPETAPMNHSNRVVFDEAAMAPGMALYAAIALAHAGRPGA